MATRAPPAARSVPADVVGERLTWCYSCRLSTKAADRLPEALTRPRYLSGSPC
jgi:hypothetical protein